MNKEVFRGESDELSSPTPLQDDTGRCVSQKWFLGYYGRIHLSPSRGTQSQTEDAERRIISSSTKVYWRCENHSHVSRKIIGKTSCSGCRKRIIRCMDRLHESLFSWSTGHLTDVHGPEGDWRGNKQPQDPTKYGQKCGSTCLMQRSAKQSKCGSSRKPKLVDARRLRGIFIVELDDEEFRHIIRKFEIPMPAARPCKTINSREGNLPQYWAKQDHVCLYCRCRRNYESTIGRCTAQISRKSHLFKMEWIHWAIKI